MCEHQDTTKKINPDSENLKKSFAEVKKEQLPIERECKILQEANRFDIPLDSYRKLFEIYTKDKINELILDNSPRFEWKNRKELLNQYCEWITKYKWSLLQKSLNLLIEKGLLISAGLAAIHYLQTIPQREKQADEEKKTSHYQAWLLINSAKDKPVEGGRKEALEDLNNAQISLEGIDVNKAFLRDIKLNRSNLQNANFRETTLTSGEFKNAYLYCANFQDTELSGVEFDQTDLTLANLERAKMEPYTLINQKQRTKTTRLSSFKDANLEEASFEGADLQQVIFSNANLNKTDFRRAKNLTPEQVQSAQNWKSAYYDVELRQKLGLPPEILDKKQSKRKILCQLSKP